MPNKLRDGVIKIARWLIAVLERDDEDTTIPPPNSRSELIVVLALAFAFALAGTAITVLVTNAITSGPVAVFSSPDGAGCGERDDNCLQIAAIHQYRWQGQWAMWTFFASVSTLAVTIVSINILRQTLKNSRDLQKQEFRAYLSVNIDSVTINAPREILIKATCNNYGRTPAYMVNGTCSISFKIMGIATVFHIGRFEVYIVSDDVHPNQPRAIKFGLFDSAAEVMEKIHKNEGQILVAIYLNYDDVFFTTHSVRELKRYRPIYYPTPDTYKLDIIE